MAAPELAHGRIWSDGDGDDDDADEAAAALLDTLGSTTMTAMCEPPHSTCVMTMAGGTTSGLKDTLVGVGVTSVFSPPPALASTRLPSPSAPLSLLPQVQSSVRPSFVSVTAALVAKPALTAIAPRLGQVLAQLLPLSTALTVAWSTVVPSPSCPKKLEPVTERNRNEKVK